MGKKEFNLLKKTRNQVIKLENTIAEIQGELEDLTKERSELRKEIKKKVKWLKNASTDKLEGKLERTKNLQENKKKRIDEEISELVLEQDKYKKRAHINHRLYTISITLFVVLVGILSQIDEMRYYTCENGEIIDSISLSDDPDEWGCWKDTPLMASAFYPSTSGFYIFWSFGFGLSILGVYALNASHTSDEIEKKIEAKKISKRELKQPTSLTNQIKQMERKIHNYSIQIQNDEQRIEKIDKQIDTKSQQIQKKSVELLELWSKVKHMLPE